MSGRTSRFVCAASNGDFHFQHAVFLQDRKLQDPEALRTIFADDDLGAVVGIKTGQSFDYQQVRREGRRRER